MKGFADFIIPLRGLKDGDHSFKYSIDDAFFRSFEQETVQAGSLTIDVKLIKRSNTFEFDFAFEGELEVACDRCLESMPLGVDAEAKLVVKIGDRYEELSDEILSITEDDMDFDLAPFVLEYIQLQVPIKKAHEDGECNQEMLDRLEELTPRKEEEVDPRWNELKNLLNKN